MECKDGYCDLKNVKTTGNNELPIPTDSSGWYVYGADWCYYCRNAKKELKKRNVAFKYIKVGKHGGPETVRSKLYDFVGDYKTIPLVFWNKYFVGGYTELLKYNPPKTTEQKTTELKTTEIKKVICGGLSGIFDATDDVKKLCNTVKSEVIKEIKFTTFEPINYKVQVVAGVNYFVKVKLDDIEYTHLRIHNSLKNETSLHSLQYPKKQYDKIEYF
jgi:cystatin-A/B